MWNALALLSVVTSWANLTPALPGIGPEVIVIEIEGGDRATGIQDAVASFGPGRHVWLGHLHGEPESSVAISHFEGAVRGVIRAPHGELRIFEKTELGYRARALAGSSASLERAPLVPAPGPPAAPRLVEDDGPLDLLVVHTPRARELAGSTGAMDALVQLGVAEANLALERSGASARLRLVELREVPYLESGRVESDLEILRSATDGALDEVHALRDAFGADLVQLVVAEDDGCGVSYLLPEATPALESWAFSVVEWSCIEDSLALAHELGHSMGCDHAPGDPTSGGAFDFSFGYRDPVSRFRTVMAYGAGRRVPRFSSPRAPLGDLPTGTESQDNARTIDRLRNGLSRFRPRIEPPRLAFSSRRTEGDAVELRMDIRAPAALEHSDWWAVAGSSPGASDLLDSGPVARDRPLGLTLPTGGRTVHVRLFYRPGRVWLYEDFRYVAPR